MIVYKVVRGAAPFESEALRSAWVSTHAPELTVEYKVGEKAFGAKENPVLFAFDTLEAAREWASFRDWASIYKARAVKSRMKIVPFGNNGIPYLILNNIKEKRTGEMPDGTVCCHSITLLERVK